MLPRRFCLALVAAMALLADRGDSAPPQASNGPEKAIDVTFNESSACSGLDSKLSPKWIMVPVSSTNTAKAAVTPESEASRIGLITLHPSSLTVSPSQLSQSSETVVLSGLAKGITKVLAKSSTSLTLGDLNATVKTEISTSVYIHVVAEENDDVQEIEVSSGQPNQVCITFGTNGVPDSTISGDDGNSGSAIHSGANGICQSTRWDDDVEVIPNGQGAPNETCVSAGANGFRDSPASSSDSVSGTAITTGADGICDTTALSNDVEVSNAPSSSALESYLNDVWGRQANVFFSVTGSTSRVVNYDLDRDGELDSATDDELSITTASAVSNAINLYFVYRLQDDDQGVAIRGGKDAWVSDSAYSARNTAAHEIGHLFNLENSGYPDELMYQAEEAEPCVITKSESDEANP